MPDDKARKPSQALSVGFASVPQQTPDSDTGETPSANTSPVTRAVPERISVTSPVATVGNSLSKTV